MQYVVDGRFDSDGPAGHTRSARAAMRAVIRAAIRAVFSAVMRACGRGVA